MRKRTFHIIGVCLAAPLLLILGILLLIQIPKVQNSVADLALEKLSESLGGSVTIGTIDIRPYGAIAIKDVLVMDSDPMDPEADTMAYIGRLTVTLSVASIFGKDCIRMDRVAIDDGQFFLTSEAAEGRKQPRTNLETVFHLVPKEIDLETPPPGGPNIFSIRKLRINNFRFRMRNSMVPPERYWGFGLNYADLDARIEQLKARRIRFAGGIMGGVVDRLDVSEKSGYTGTLKGSASVGMGAVKVDGMKLKDPWSDIDFRFLNLTFINGRAFSDFLNRVTIEARFRPSHISMTTLSYIGSGSLSVNKGEYEISKGHILGPVSNVKLNRFRFRETLSGLSGEIDGRVYGLPDMKLFGLDMKMNSVTFTSGGLSRYINGWARGSSLDFGSIAPGRKFTLNGSATGLLNRLKVDAVLDSHCGELSLGAFMSGVLDKEEDIHIAAEASTSSIDLGKLLSSESLGSTDMAVKADLLLAKPSMQLVVDSLKINSLQFKGYEYKNITAGARLENNNLWARLVSGDENLQFSLLGNADLAPREGLKSYKLGADFRKVDLAALHLLKDQSSLGLSFGLDVNMTSDDRMIFDGDVRIGNLFLKSITDSLMLKEIRVKAGRKGQEQSISLDSEPLSLDLHCDRSPLNLVNDFMNASVRREMSAFCPPLEHPDSTGNYEINLTTSNLSSVASFFKSGLYVENGTTVSAGLNDSGLLNLELNSGRVAIGTNYIKDLRLSLDNALDAINLQLEGSTLNTGFAAVSSPLCKMSVNNNLMTLQLTMNDKDNQKLCTDIGLTALAFRDRDDKLVINAVTRPSVIETYSNRWLLDESSFTFGSGGITVENLYLHSGDQNLIAYGAVNTGYDETLTVDMNRFDLSSFNALLNKDNCFEGTASGSAVLQTGPDNYVGMTADIRLDSLAIGGYAMGDLTLNSALDETDQRIRLRAENHLDGRTSLKLGGYYLPSANELDARITLDRFGLAPMSTFLSAVFSETGGSVSGDIHAFGPADALNIETEGTGFNDALVRLALTGAPYYINGPFSADNTALNLSSISIRDDSGGTASLTGALNYNSLKEMNLEARLDFSKLKLIDSKEGPASTFYGNMHASGYANVSGPFSALVIDANVTTDGKGDIHLPLSGKLSSTRGELLTYVEHNTEDAYDQMIKQLMEKPQVQSKSDIQVKARVGITEGLNAYMEIDKGVGNVISIGGNGHVNLDIRPSKALFNLSGDYNIVNGNYHFVIPGILEKDLKIKEGSSVKFGGDLMDSQIDITAIYNLKTSLGTLITDTTAVSTRKNVECGLTISNRLSNPDIKFFINVPDLDPTTKGLVDGCLNTDDKVQKQFVALLLLGSFIPNESNGVFNGANMLYSNLGEVVSSQLNNILRKLDIPVDLGLRYEETKRGNNVFDVAVSTQLFNNRVTVSGNVGNRKYKNGSAATSDFVGDVDIEVKIDKEGKFRVKLFSHSADSYTNFLDNSQRNGVGLSFQRDFSRRKDGEEEQKVKIEVE